MKTTINLLLTIIFVSYTNAQAPAIEWQKSFGGSTDDFAKSIQVTSDGGYIVAGDSSSNNGNITENHGGIDYWVVKLDAVGTIQWQKTYGGSNNDYANSIVTTTDGGYIIAGVSNSTDGDVTGNHGGQDYWVIKINSIGTIQWQKSYGGSNTDVAKSIQTTLDGGYIVAGQSASGNGDVIGNHNSIDFWVIKLDSSGDILWQNSLGGTNYDVAFSIKLTLDGGYLVAGQSGSNDGDVTGNHGSQDFWIVKLDVNGAIQWQKSIGGSNIDIIYDIQTTSDGYIMAGISNSSDGDATGNSGNTNFWVVKVNFTGIIQWQKSFGGTFNDTAYAIQTTSDGGYVVSGISASTDGVVTGNHGSYDYWVVKLNDIGILQWQKSFGGTGDDQAYSIQNTTNGGYIIAGHSASNNGDVTGNHGGYDYWVVKLGPDLATTTFEQQSIVLYPNPVRSILNIQTATLAQISKVKIIDIQGKIVLEQSQNTNTINVENLAKGFYILQAYSGDQKHVSKFIKE